MYFKNKNFFKRFLKKKKRIIIKNMIQFKFKYKHVFVLIIVLFIVANFANPINNTLQKRQGKEPDTPKGDIPPKEPDTPKGDTPPKEPDTPAKGPDTPTK